MSPSPRELLAALDRDHVPRRPKPPYRDSDRVAVTFRADVQRLRETLVDLADALVIQLQDKDGIPERALDRSPASLAVLDQHIFATDYPNAFKRDYLRDWFVPALGGYLTAVTLQHAGGWLQWKFGARVTAHALQPGSGGVMFYPFDLAESAVTSGYRLAHFFDVVASYARRQPGTLTDDQRYFIEVAPVTAAKRRRPR